MPPSLSELKVTPSFCFPIKIRDDRTASIIYSRFDDEQKKNDLCKPIDAPHLPSQWFQLQYISNLNGQLIGKALGKVIDAK